MPQPIVRSGTARPVEPGGFPGLPSDAGTTLAAPELATGHMRRVRPSDPVVQGAELLRAGRHGGLMKRPPRCGGIFLTGLRSSQAPTAPTRLANHGPAGPLSRRPSLCSSGRQSHCSLQISPGRTGLPGDLVPGHGFWVLDPPTGSGRSRCLPTALVGCWLVEPAAAPEGCRCRWSVLPLPLLAPAPRPIRTLTGDPSRRGRVRSQSDPRSGLSALCSPHCGGHGRLTILPLCGPARGPAPGGSEPCPRVTIS